MRRSLLPLFTLCFITFLLRADDISERSRKLHFSSIVIDTHDDTTQRFFTKDFDLGKRNSTGHIDIPRMKEGGMNAIFFSIWIDGRTMGPLAIQKALDQIDAVKQNVARYPNEIVLARTAEDVRQAHAQHKIAALMGIEGGHMLGNDIRMVRIYSELGVRYMTLSHFYNDEWADSSTDKPAHNGLTDYGKEIVREMNRTGMMVDISHVSDKTFYDALEVSKAPLIASHSSCRALCNHPRDMTDDMIKAIRDKDGIVGITWFPEYCSAAHQQALEEKARSIDLNALGFEAGGPGMPAIATLMRSCGPDMHAKYNVMITERLPMPTVDTIVKHVAYVANLIGADRVCLGSDHGAVRFDIPGFEDCTKWPVVTQALKDHGFSDGDVRGVLGGNVLRLMERVIGE